MLNIIFVNYRRRCINLLVLILIGFTAVSAQNIPTLKFSESGKFKIVQFTDIHMKEYNVGKRDSVLELMSTILEKEKPDLVVLTGDIATSENVELAWQTVVKPIIEKEIPWAAVFGNHDYEHGYSNKKIMEYLVTLPYNCSQFGPSNISGIGNYVLEILGSSSNNVEALLYCLDSHAYTTDTKNLELGKYAWINFDQIKWYRDVSKDYTAKNKDIPFPALAFFHIPLPEYNVIVDSSTTIGVKNEIVCSPFINSGMYNAFLESKDVMGTFAGHDHVNNYIGCLNNICLAYGCKTGLESYGNLPKGARVIELYEGRRKFDTWIHDTESPKKHPVNFPDSFVTVKSPSN